MAGSPERPEKEIPEKVREAMVRFEVDERRVRQSPSKPFNLIAGLLN
jgi:hypothetical protein